MTDLQTGRLEQACPDCGTWEAAGAYCTKCRRPMGSGDWYRNGDEDRRAVAHRRATEIASTRVKRGPGRPRRVSALPADGTLFGMTSPLRAGPAESSDPRPQLPLGGGPVEDSAGVREHTSRRIGPVGS